MMSWPNRAKSRLFRFILHPSSFILLIVLHPSSFLRADGGRLQTCQQRGPFQVSVFVAPMPPRTGIVDVSVLVKESKTGRIRTDVPVTVRMSPISHSGSDEVATATPDAATNKLFQAAKLHVPQAGTWQVTVCVDGQPSPICFDLVVETGMPAWWDMGLWLAWPFIAVLLFGAHRWRVHRHDHTAAPVSSVSNAISGRQL